MAQSTDTMFRVVPADKVAVLQKSLVNLSAFASTPLLLTAPKQAVAQGGSTGACEAGLGGAQVAALARGLAEKEEAAVACSGFKFETNNSSWIPLFYLLMPASFHGGAALLMFR